MERLENLSGGLIAQGGNHGGRIDAGTESRNTGISFLIGKFDHTRGNDLSGTDPDCADSGGVIDSSVISMGSQNGAQKILWRNLVGPGVRLDVNENIRTRDRPWRVAIHERHPLQLSLLHRLLEIGPVHHLVIAARGK